MKSALAPAPERTLSLLTSVTGSLETFKALGATKQVASYEAWKSRLEAELKGSE